MSLLSYHYPKAMSVDMLQYDRDARGPAANELTNVATVSIPLMRTVTRASGSFDARPGAPKTIVFYRTEEVVDSAHR